MQATAVHDADASKLTVTAVLDEPSDAHAGLGSRHPVQVAPVSDGVLAALQLPDLAPVDAMRGEVLVRSVTIVG
jgi:hypothetical protein